MYSSVWNWVISYFEAGFARYAIRASVRYLRLKYEIKDWETHIDFHLLVKAIIHDQAVGHTYAMRLHRMTGDVGIVAHIGVVEVGNLLVVGGDAIGERFSRHVAR